MFGEIRDDVSVWIDYKNANLHVTHLISPGHRRAHQLRPGADDASDTVDTSTVDAEQQGLGIGSTGAATSTELGHLE